MCPSAASSSDDQINDNVSKAHVEAHPFLLKPWIFLYNRISSAIQIKLPFTNTNITFTIVVSFWFVLVKLFIKTFVIPPYFPADSDITHQIIINLTSITHAILLCVPLGTLLLTQPFVPSAPMKQAPQWWQCTAHAMLEFCTGYMLYDGLYNSLYLKLKTFGYMDTGDYCFLGHHLATSYYMTSTRMNGAGHLSAMIIMFFGEITNPFQNGRKVMDYILFHAELQECCSNSELIRDTLYPLFDFTYALMYAVIRVGLNPYLNIRITYDFLCTKEGRQRMSIPLSLSLLLMLWGVTFGTIPWCLESVNIVQSYILPGEAQEL